MTSNCVKMIMFYLQNSSYLPSDILPTLPAREVRPRFLLFHTCLVTASGCRHQAACTCLKAFSSGSLIHRRVCFEHLFAYANRSYTWEAEVDPSQSVGEF